MKEKFDPLTMVEYGSAFAGRTPSEAATAMAASLEAIGPRDWVEMPAIMLGPVTDSRLIQPWGWHGVARREGVVEKLARELSLLRTRVARLEGN